MPLELEAGSYGSTDGVAVMCAIWTDNGTFTGATKPTEESVVTWLNQVSGFMNLALANEGFQTPVTQAAAKSAIDAIVNQYVSDMVQASNSSGRFFSERYLQAGVGMLTVISKEINDWVNTTAGGLVILGVVRNTNPSDQIGFRSHDDAGEETFPIFQRNGFGNRFDNWTK